MARTIAFAAPFRLRPVYDPAVQHQPYSWPAYASLENWSAFPSDTATFFFGLACGIACLSRRLAIPITLYTAVWISLPRMYFGIHYASDMVMGAAIGIAVVWFALRIGWLRSRLASRALAAAHATPSVFYAAAFLVSYEMATMFDDIRAVVRGLLHVARIGPHQETVRSALIAVAILGLVAGGACLAFQYRPSRGAREPRALPQ